VVVGVILYFIYSNVFVCCPAKERKKRQHPPRRRFFLGGGGVLEGEGHDGGGALYGRQ